MKKAFLQIFHEIRLQLTDTPGFVDNILQRAIPPGEEQMKQISEQIASALGDSCTKFIFLVGPSGVGKTAQICYFLKNYKRPSTLYKSFVKIRSIDYAFLHLTSFVGRLGFLFMTLGLSYTVAKLLGVTDALALLLTAGYFFTKNAPNLLYIFNETFQNLFQKEPKLIVIEDLEKGSLTFNDRWAFLANLWLNKRTYLVSLAYSVDDKTEKLRLLEAAMNLNGTIIEISIDQEKNYKMMKELDPDFPFKKIDLEEEDGWISLFTPQELCMIHQQVLLRCTKWTASQKKRKDKEFFYKEIFLDLLIKKLGLVRDNINLDSEGKIIQGIGLEDLSDEKKFYIDSFARSFLNNPLKK